MAQVGVDRPAVFHVPRVAILSSGDEVVAPSQTPGPYQIRNSNSFSLATLVEMAGGEPVSLGNSPDEVSSLRARILEGLEANLLVITGGVSMGKCDLVKAVLRDLGATFHFDSVAIRPGKPTVFGRCRDRFFFGLPGNPISTMVTFSLFVRPAIDILGGATVTPLSLASARLAGVVWQEKGLKAFLPAKLDREGNEVRVRTLPWQGSGDLVTLARSDCFLVFPDDQECLKADEYATVVFLWP
jgi:molybdopterin molybdotransferase